MIRLLALGLQVLLLALAGYNAVTALWGWRDRSPAPPGRRDRRLRIVIPAHNEESVIGGILSDLQDNAYPGELDITVVADKCTDATASLARRAGVTVMERWTEPQGKGAAIAWFLEHRPLEPDDVLVVLDADNRVGPSLLCQIVDEVDAGHEAVQCYLDVTNPDASLLAEAAALSYWASNRMVQLARSNLGWSADLGGTGMALTGNALEAAGGFTEALAEDQDLGTRLLLADHPVEWLHDGKVYDEKPTTLRIAVKQRARWMAGRRTAARTHLRALFHKRTPASLDQALRLIQPGRGFVALLSCLFTVLAAATASKWLLPSAVWATATAVQVLEPVPFLAKEGVPPRRLLRYPVLALIGALWMPVRVLSGRVDGWYHTPHGSGDSSDQARVPDDDHYSRRNLEDPHRRDLGGF